MCIYLCLCRISKSLPHWRWLRTSFIGQHLNKSNVLLLIDLSTAKWSKSSWIETGLVLLKSGGSNWHHAMYFSFMGCRWTEKLLIEILLLSAVAQKPFNGKDIYKPALISTWHGNKVLKWNLFLWKPPAEFPPCLMCGSEWIHPFSTKIQTCSCLPELEGRLQNHWQDFVMGKWRQKKKKEQFLKRSVFHSKDKRYIKLWQLAIWQSLKTSSRSTSTL